MPTFVIAAIARPLQNATIRGSRISVGRDALCDLLLPGETVSREHAVFVQDRSGQWHVDRVSSKNPLVVDGVLILTSAAVREGSEILIGTDYLVIFSESEATARAYHGDARFVACECPGCGWKGRLGAFNRAFACPRCNSPSKPLSIYDRKQAGKKAAGGATAELPAAEARRRFDLLRTAKRSHVERIDGHGAPDAHRDLTEDEPLLLGGKEPGALPLFGLTLGGGARIAWDGAGYVAESSMTFPAMRVNGVKARTAALKSGDVVEIGSNRLRVVTA